MPQSTWGTVIDKITCTFYVRFPGYLGDIARDQWVPRLEGTKIENCPMDVGLLFGEGKEKVYGQGTYHAGWGITVGGVTPLAAGVNPYEVKNATYVPGTRGAQCLKDMAQRYSRVSGQTQEAEDWRCDRTPYFPGAPRAACLAAEC